MQSVLPSGQPIGSARAVRSASSAPSTMPRGRNRARPGQRHPGARPLALGYCAIRRRWLQHADGRVPHRCAPQAARQGGDLRQFGVRAHLARSKSAALPAYRKGIAFPGSKSSDFGVFRGATNGPRRLLRSLKSSRRRHARLVRPAHKVLTFVDLYSSSPFCQNSGLRAG
jgi:hypothetical protein